MRIGFLVVATLLASAARSQTAVPCEGPKAKAAMDVDVRRDPPVFSTGRGWLLAPIVGSLARQADFVICERRLVGFYGSRKTWLRIEFAEHKSGWIPEEALLSAARITPAWSLIRAARADELHAGIGAPGTTQLYLAAFLAMLLGMVAKAFYDYVDPDFEMRSYLRVRAKAVVVSPLAFLGLMKSGDFAFDPGVGSLVVFVCIAFQNGFFWQTLLVKPGTLGLREESSPKPAVQMKEV